MSGKRDVEVIVDVTQQASTGSYTVRVSGGPAQGAAGGPFSGDSVRFDVHVVEAANESAGLLRSVIDPGPIERESLELDGNADIVIKGNSCLTLWAGG